MHYTWPNGKGTLLVGVEPTRPSYARLVEMLKGVPNTRASRSWVDRVLDINNLKGAPHLAPCVGGGGGCFRVLPVRVLLYNNYLKVLAHLAA